MRFQRVHQLAAEQAAERVEHQVIHVAQAVRAAEHEKQPRELPQLNERRKRERRERDLAEIRERLVRLLAQAGVSSARAAQLSTLMVAAYEGALIQSRVAGSVQPVSDISEMVVEWVRREIQSKDRKDQV